MHGGSHDCHQVDVNGRWKVSRIAAASWRVTPVEFVNTDRPWIVPTAANEYAITAAVARESVESYTLSQDNLDYLSRGLWKHFLTVSWIHTNNWLSVGNQQLLPDDIHKMNNQSSNSVDIPVPNSIQIARKTVVNTGKASFIFLSKALLSLYGFLPISSLLDSIRCRSSIQNFKHVVQEIWKMLVEIHLRPQVKYDCHWAEFCNTHIYWTNLCKEGL
jgi:hypothetical protein